MKIEIPRPLLAAWLALTDVPGWPDAPMGARLRRLWPLAVPLVICVVVLCWVHLSREPMRARVRAAHAELLALESETAQLRQSLSEQAAEEISRQAAEARALLLASPAALEESLAAFLPQAREAGWEASWQTYGLSEDESSGPSGPDSLLFAPARVRLEPRAENTDRLTSLVATLDRLSNLPGRVEITRITIRTQPSGLPIAEVNLRAACRPADEKTAQ